jgi:molecular chaperone IbpA
MTRTYTFNTASLGGPWAIGFESLLDRFSNAESINSSSNYPPYNIIKHDAEHWSIELAVAGFKRDELDVELAEGVLTVTGKAQENVLETDDIIAVKSAKEYMHRGIAKRAFTRTWTLADDVVVRDATLVDGVLAIDLERIIPEEKKPRKIDIL